MELPGWSEDISRCRSIDELPSGARGYLTYISDFLGIPIGMVGSANRDEMIWTGATAEGAPRGRLNRLRPYDVRGHRHVVQRTILVIPERPEIVEQPEGGTIDETMPTANALTAISRSAAQPKPIVRPVSRTTLIPSSCFPRVCPL